MNHLGFRLERQHLPAFASVSLGDFMLLLSGPGASGSRPMPGGESQQPGGWNRVVLRVADLRAQSLPPKLFARLARFGRVLQRIDTAANVDWADLAVSTGYFDQPHFIGDFSQFAGVTPSAYLRYRTARNHVRIAD